MIGQGGEPMEWVKCADRLPEWGVSVICGWADHPDEYPCEGIWIGRVDGVPCFTDARGIPFHWQPTDWMPMPLAPSAWDLM